MQHKLPTHTAWATWQPAHVATRRITVSRTLDAGTGAAETIATAPMPDTGQPTRGQLDDVLAVLGFTRRGPWATTTTGLVADVEPIRPEGSTP